MHDVGLQYVPMWGWFPFTETFTYHTIDSECKSCAETSRTASCHSFDGFYLDTLKGKGL